VYSFNSLDDKTKYCYSGCLEGRGFDECGEHGFVVLDVNNKEITHTFVPFAKRTLHEISIDISTASNTHDVDNLIRKELTNVSKDSLLKINLVGNISENVDIDTELLSSALNELYYFAKVLNKTKLNINIDNYKNDMSIKGEFVRTVLNSKLPTEEQEKIIITGLKALNGEGDL
jgi:uncharacterized protein YaaR (DUF327 family)